MTAINMIHVIEGKPTISSGLMASLVRQAGHRLRVTTGFEGDKVTDKPWATADLVRRDDPDFTFRSTWTVARATEAGLMQKSNYKHYLVNMLKARAISEVCRDACPEVLAGIQYSPDELGEPFLTDTERDDMGLMTRHELAEHSQLERTQHDSSKTLRLHAGDEDTDGSLWESPLEDAGDAPDAK